MHRAQEQVRNFHRDVVKQPMSPAEPKIRMGELRASLILEEAIETVVALVGRPKAVAMLESFVGENRLVYPDDEAEAKDSTPNIVEVIDGLCDTIVVSYGTAEALGIDLEPFYDEVMRSNMAKAGGPVREDGKMLKPPGWTPPDIAGVLVALNARMTKYKIGDTVIINRTCRRGCCDEGSIGGIVDEIQFNSNGEPYGAWVNTVGGGRTYAHFTETKGVMES